MAINDFAAPLVWCKVQLQEAALGGALLADFLATGEVRGTARIFGMRPMSFDFESNGFQEPDTLTLRFRGRDFPFDPRTIESVEVQHYFAAATEPNQTVERINPDSTAHDPAAVQDHTLMFSGFVVDPGRSISGDEDVITWECTDNTDVLMTPYTGGRIDESLPIAQVIRNILSTLPAAGDLTVVEGAGYSPVVLKSKRPAHLKGGRPVKPYRGRDRRESYWSLIHEMASEAGMMAVIEFDRLILTRRSGIYLSPDTTPTLALGVNVSRFEINRPYGSSATPNIEVVASDPDSETVIIGRYPDPPRLMKARAGKSRTKEVSRYTVGGIKDAEHAAFVAREIFEAQARGDIKIKIETQDTIFADGRDLTKIRAGSPVYVSAQTTSTHIPEDLTGGELVEFLISLGYDEEISQALADTWGDQRIFGQPYYTETASHSWDLDDGYRLKLTVMNFIETLAGE